MAGQTINFRDGARYDAMMGPWSRSAGEVFLDWLEPLPGLAWVDVGCGSGAFTALAVERHAPASILGIDPSEAQLQFARARNLGSIARFETGDAMALQVKDGSCDIAVAALVVHFMPDPAQGVSEMARIVKPGGIVAAYAWDLPGGGFPYEAVHERLRQLGSPAPIHLIPRPAERTKCTACGRQRGSMPSRSVRLSSAGHSWISTITGRRPSRHPAWRWCSRECQTRFWASYARAFARICVTQPMVALCQVPVRTRSAAGCRFSKPEL